MTPGQYVDLFRERWRVVVAALLLGVAVAVAYVQLTPRQYAAEVTMFVSAGTSTDAAAALDRNLLSAQRMQTYVELLTSEKIAGEVVEDLGLPVSGADLAERVTASSTPDTVLLTATVTDPDPFWAAEIANTLADDFIDNVAELEQPSDPLLGPLVVAAVFAEAVPPVDAVSPRPALALALGALLGLAAGIGLAVLRRALDTAVRTPARLAAAVDAPVLGVFTRDRAARRSPLVVRGNPRGFLAEAYRRVRTCLRAPEQTVLLVASASPGEGRTSVLGNLACALADAGRRVLVIDADLRHPRVAEVFGVRPAVGLADVLGDPSLLARAVQPWSEGLDVVAGGSIPPNPAELLGSPPMARLLADVRGRYDVVLVDAPPLLPVADATALAELVDGVVLVVRHGSAERRVREARDALAAVSAPVLGTVLTMAPGGRRWGSRRGFGAAPAAPGPTVARPDPVDVVPALPPGGPRPDPLRPSPVPRQAVVLEKESAG